jgi:hypothetical protein
LADIGQVHVVANTLARSRHGDDPEGPWAPLKTLTKRPRDSSEPFGRNDRGSGPAVDWRLSSAEDLLERVPVDVKLAADGAFALAVGEDAAADLGPVLHVGVHP